MSGITQHRIRVELANADPIEVTTANPDLVRFDMTRAKHGWPSMEDAYMLWATFVAWHAAKRSGLYDGTWETWSERDCLDIDFLDETGESKADALAGTEVDPTPPVPAPDSP